MSARTEELTTVPGVGDSLAELLWSRRDDAEGGVRFGAERWSWAEVVTESVRRARLIDELRTGPGAVHLGVFLENVPDYVFWLGAAALSGSVVVGVNPTRRGADLAADIRHTDCDLLVVETTTAALVADVDHGIESARVLDIDTADYAARVAAADVAGYQPNPVSLADPYLLLFSSGSTGAPKAVICSHGRLGGLAHALAERMRIDRDTVTYLCMPLFHGNAVMTNLAPAIRSGATVVLARKFSASGFLPDIKRYGVTYWNYVGRALAYVLATPSSPDDAENALRLAYGTEASAADIERFAERFGCEVMEGYGASEGGLRINLTPDTPSGSLGRTVGERPMEIVNEETLSVCAAARFDADGVLLNADEAIGQMVVRGGAQAFEGYYRNEEAYAERVRGEDFWTGDLAYRDEEGFVYFAGRTADWMRVDSENIAAAPIERVLQRHPEVRQAVVYGVPDARTGDQVMATLELADEVTFSAVGFQEFLAGQRDMGTKWRPRFVRISRELPVTGNGKVARADLRRAGWRCPDPVWILEADGSYASLTDERRAALRAEFAEHGREHLIGATL
ncbi:AMP-binding protein [Nocardioides sp. Bht2]|uniref:AMP-binding protein n=1 Tax=Nocardioides sp. Bht2 TaxID=3392297 RepID=UPI0039B48ADD